MSNIAMFPDLRQLPANLGAEQALLGTLIQRNATFDKVCDLLQPEYFSDAASAALYAYIGTRLGAGSTISLQTLKGFAESPGPILDAGGMRYIVSLCASSPTLVNAKEYAEIIVDAFLRRELILLTSGASAAAYDGSSEALEQISAIEEQLFKLTDRQTLSGEVHVSTAAGQAIEQANAAYKADGEVVGVPCGLVDLDRKLGGLHKSELIILAGRPSMGKTGAATTFAINAARAGKKVAFFSLEMSAPQVANRVLAHFTRLDSHNIRNGRLSAGDFQKLFHAKSELEKLPLEIEDMSAPTVAQIRTACRRMKRKRGLDLIVVDYLQLVRGTGGEGNRVEEVSGISRGLKSIARDLNVPVVALSQLSRQVENREDKRPQLSDLRESGSIEQDADVVMFVYRQEYYTERNGDPVPADQQNVAEINIAKQRHGPIGGVPCRFDKASAWFENLARGNDGRA